MFFVGILQQALECLVDSSIFVADSARKFVAKYLVSLYNSSLANSNQMENGLQGSTNHDCLRANTDSCSIELSMCYRCIICHLKHVIEQLPTSSRERPVVTQFSFCPVSFLKNSCPVSFVPQSLAFFRNADRLGRSGSPISGFFLFPGIGYPKLKKKSGFRN